MTKTFLIAYSTICDYVNNLSICGQLRTSIHSFISDNALVILTDGGKLSPSDRNKLCELMILLENKINTKRKVFKTTETNKCFRVETSEVCVTLDFENVD